MEKDVDIKFNGCATLRDTTTFVIHYEGNEEHWQEYFFKLMSYKNTYSGCRELTIRSNYHSGKTWIVMVVENDKLYPFENLVANLFEKYDQRATKELVLDSCDINTDVDDIFVE